MVTKLDDKVEATCFEIAEQVEGQKDYFRGIKQRFNSFESISVQKIQFINEQLTGYQTIEDGIIARQIRAKELGNLLVNLTGSRSNECSNGAVDVATSRSQVKKAQSTLTEIHALMIDHFGDLQQALTN